MKNILVITGNEQAGAEIRAVFKSPGHVLGVSNLDGALRSRSKKRHDLVFVAFDAILSAPGKPGVRDVVRVLKERYPGAEIVLIASSEDIPKAVEGVKAGASTYVNLPVNPDEIRLVVDSLDEKAIIRSELDYLRDRFWHSDVMDLVRTENQAMHQVYQKIRAVAATRATVLLSGETGTGKGVLARLIHSHSNREKERFIAVHCGAIPDTLVESELFGHEKGAFTGASRRKLGRFEIARDGTIFLDEIGTISNAVQIKLLQVLQDGEFSRVGGEDTLFANARIIAATNLDLKKMTETGDFRKDLFYRLNVFPIEVPPLRQRIEDVPLLAETCLNRLNREFQKSIQTIHADVVSAMQAYAWPGNIRELENLMERAYILETSPVLTPSGFPAELFNECPRDNPLFVDASIHLSEARRRAVESFERRYIESLLAGHHGRIGSAAEAAGISSRQLNKLMSRYRIRKETYKN